MTIADYISFDQFLATYPDQNCSSRADTPMQTTQKTQISIRQLKAQLAANGQLKTIENAVNADVTNLVTIQWRNGSVCTPFDTLYVFVQTTLGLTDLLMDVLFTSAIQQPW